MNNNIEVFTNIYETCSWGNNNEKNYNGSSGGGSSINFNLNTYIPFLKNFIKEKEIKTVVDLGCGDFLTGKYIYDDLPVKYQGYDAYNKIVKHNSSIFDETKYKFTHLDFCNQKEDLISADLCIIKDVLQHWCLKDIYIFLDYLTKSKKYKYILICNCSRYAQDNIEINTGDFRPLSCEFYPLKSFNLKKVYNYETKEVSVITY